MLRRLRGRFGISAPKVAVRTHVPWHLRIAVALGGLVLIFALATLAFDAGRRVAGFDQSEAGQLASELRATNASLEEELARLRSLLTASESSLQIEQAAQQALSERNSVLAAENARLKEELAVFERLTRLESKIGNEVLLDRLSVRQEPSGYRYSFLIALQGVRRGKDSTFDMQLVVSPRAGASGAKIILPSSDDPNVEQYRIALRNFRRIEGRLDVPADYQLGSIEVRISESGNLKASKSITL
ncbi:MAG: DUF6776 family protein [Pseudomonadota bacterium]